MKSRIADPPPVAQFVTGAFGAITGSVRKKPAFNPPVRKDDKQTNNGKGEDDDDRIYDDPLYKNL